MRRGGFQVRSSWKEHIYHARGKSNFSNCIQEGVCSINDKVDINFRWQKRRKRTRAFSES